VDSEDFGLQNAKRLLDKYRGDIPCFNDDIQGTGCVTLAALMAGLHVSKVALKDVRVVCFGAGSAGTGIADQISDAIATESGREKADAMKQVWCIDKQGLLLKSQGDSLTETQRFFAKEDGEWPEGEDIDLLSVIKRVKPHVLIGTSTKPGAFTEEIIREMARHVEHPIVFPLSNPTRLHEAQPQDLAEWTDGKALVATGSPFPPVEFNGVKKEIGMSLPLTGFPCLYVLLVKIIGVDCANTYTAECNNSTAFPGIGLGAVLSRTRRVSEKMIVAASKALAAKAPALEDPNKPLLPDVEDVRELSLNVAKAVIQTAVEEGLAQEEGIPEDEGVLKEWIRVQMWEAEYQELEKV
jgi:malate dehydrogenase (oxaloacetate-decarboxylating)